MNENTGQFRTSTFGGFHRQDVLDYIEQLTRNYKEEKDALMVQIEEIKKAGEEEQESKNRLEEECSELRAAKEAAEKELLEAREAIQGEDDARKNLEAQIYNLELKIKEMEPSVKAWKLIRQTAGEIEVNAYERAQSTIQDAKEKADKIRSEGLVWLSEAQERCDRLRQDLKSSILSAQKQLDLIRDAFSKTEVDLEGIQDSVANLAVGLQPEEDG